MRVILFTQLVVLALASCIAGQAGAQGAAERAEADVARMDAALGAIRVSADWRQTVFVLVNEQERTVVETPVPVDLPYGSDANSEPPPGYGPVGFWTELKPGRYVLIAASPGKQLAEAAVQVTAGKEVWLNAKLEAERSRIRVSQPLEKIGPTWSKRELSKAEVKYRQ